MLSDQEKELLTVFVDGEMGRRQRRFALRLLHRSSEARSFLQDLQENAHALRLLPRQKLGADFAGTVLQEIVARGLKPQTNLAARPRRPLPVWFGAAAAACVLLGVGLWVAYHGPAESPSTLVATLPEPSPPEPSRAPVLITFEDLASKDKQEKLREELKRETSVHLDLNVKNTSNAVAKLVDAFQEKKDFKLVVTPSAVASLKKSHATTQYVVYAEGLQPEEVASIIEQLGKDKGKAATQTNFQSVTVASLSRQDCRQLSDMIGVQVDRFAASAKAEQKTQKHVDAAAAPAQKNSGQERFAVVLARADSDRAFNEELNGLLSHRSGRSGLQVLVVVQTAVA